MDRVSLCAVALFTTSTLVSIELMELHGPDGQTVFINKHEVSSLRQPTKSDIKLYFPKHASCIVVTTNGKFYATVESCQRIRDLLTAPPHS